MECRAPESSQTNSVCPLSGSDMVAYSTGMTFMVQHIFTEVPNFHVAMNFFFFFLSNGAAHLKIEIQSLSAHPNAEVWLQVKFLSSQNISGASRQNSIAAFFKETAVDWDYKTTTTMAKKH